MNPRRDLLDLMKRYKELKADYHDARNRHDEATCRELSEELDQVRRAIEAAKEADRG